MNKSDETFNMSTSPEPIRGDIEICPRYSNGLSGFTFLTHVDLDDVLGICFDPACQKHARQNYWISSTAISHTMLKCLFDILDDHTHSYQEESVWILHQTLAYLQPNEDIMMRWYKHVSYIWTSYSARIDSKTMTTRDVERLWHCFRIMYQNHIVDVNNESNRSLYKLGVIIYPLNCTKPYLMKLFPRKVGNVSIPILIEFVHFIYGSQLDMQRIAIPSRIWLPKDGPLIDLTIFSQLHGIPLDLDGVFVAGGSVLSLLNPKLRTLDTSDIDVFILTQSMSRLQPLVRHMMNNSQHKECVFGLQQDAILFTTFLQKELDMRDIQIICRPETSILTLVSGFDYVHNQCWIENSQLFSTAAMVQSLLVFPTVVLAHSFTNQRRCRQLRAIAKGFSLTTPLDYKEYELDAIRYDKFPRCKSRAMAHVFMRKRMSITTYLDPTQINAHTLRPMIDPLISNQYQFNAMQPVVALIRDQKDETKYYRITPLLIKAQLSNISGRKDSYITMNGSIIKNINPVQIVENWNPSILCKFRSSESMSNDLIFRAQQMEYIFRQFHDEGIAMFHSTAEFLQKSIVIIKTDSVTQWFNSSGLLIESPIETIKISSWWIPTICPLMISQSNFKFLAVQMRECHCMIY